jgi:single-stranded-DNA-specific exonuclease
VDLELSLGEATHELERMCRYLEPCGSGNASPVFGVRGVRLTGTSRVGNGHLKGTLEDGTTRLAAIGFQWADRVPWLGEALVDAAFRLELNDWTGHATLQARLCAVSPHAGGQSPGVSPQSSGL